MDTLVFDIETQNFFTDPGVGWDNFAALKISVVGVYSYLYDKYFVFEENEMNKLAELFREARRIVGFSMNRYDVPVLNNYFQKLRSGAPNLWEKERVDLLEEIEMAAKTRVSLSRLAEANLGVKKDRHGSEAIVLYREGKMEELKEYCLNDVKLTKELYDLYGKQNYFLMPDKKTGEIVKVMLAKPLATGPALF
ncbi:MAG TPA: ribonuclease H-like domain-containing protein [Candidatus Paceibacterota bacterium]|jgi:DEAD/DEAH box helicase domain-containing protein|nr:ribonuclease H-like domain-containing protein [Candidatus Paceibacterota bacterium]